MRMSGLPSYHAANVHGKICRLPIPPQIKAALQRVLEGGPEERAKLKNEMRSVLASEVGNESIKRRGEEAAR